ncbi:hypothetical protein D5086_007721 [Populus alba]|uniref:Uncharacterized protein n=1 Tax=Populus alba TaxID=43335 RepID=A0ACC4CDC2_POPAL
MRLQAKLVVILVLSFSSASSLNHFESSDPSMPYWDLLFTVLHDVICFINPDFKHLSKPFLQQQRSHVPKFGGWDKDNVPYTAYFDNARRGKSGVRMNPNDPEENPEAFMHNNLTSESGSEKSSSDHSLLQAQKTGLAVEGNKALSSSRHSRQRSGSTHPFDHGGVSLLIAS